jgi:magnesium-transporting ATPase (P-type)
MSAVEQEEVELSNTKNASENKLAPTTNEDDNVKLDINVATDVEKEGRKEERKGLTTAEAEEAYKVWGYNELPVESIPLWYVFLKQFTGVMPYTMEICILVAAGCQSWADFGIIIAMVS